jgi:hypothetical protein
MDAVQIFLGFPLGKLAFSGWGEVGLHSLNHMTPLEEAHTASSPGGGIPCHSAVFAIYYGELVHALHLLIADNTVEQVLIPALTAPRAAVAEVQGKQGTAHAMQRPVSSPVGTPLHCSRKEQERRRLVCNLLLRVSPLESLTALYPSVPSHSISKPWSAQIDPGFFEV